MPSSGWRSRSPRSCNGSPSSKRRLVSAAGPRVIRERPAEHNPSPPTEVVRVSSAPDDHNYRLLRCEGFRVESPAGEIGIVTGLRFGSRLDRPDQLEIEVGRVRRRPLLIPVEDVEQIWLDDERIRLSHDPCPHPYRKHVHDALLRLRRRPPISSV